MADKDSLSILLVVRHPVGGIRTYIRYVYGQPAFRKCKFTIVFCESDLTELIVETTTNLGFQYETCKDSNLALLVTLCKQLRLRRYDIIHSHGFTSGVISSLPLKIFSIPHIMTVHDVLLKSQFVGIKGRLKRKLLPFFFNCIDTINTVSKDVENNITEMLPQVGKERLFTILNGIDIGEFSHVTPRDLHRELNLNQDVYLIGFLGRFMSQKGFKYLIDAVELLIEEGTQKEFRVIAVGSFGFIREDRALIKIKGLEKYFIFLPAVSNAASLLKAMNVIVVPSLWEACPLLPMEALLLGIPLIASDCIGLREVVQGTPAFIARAGDSVKLANAIEHCLTDDRRAEFVNYRITARERFDSSKTANELMHLFQGRIS